MTVVRVRLFGQYRQLAPDSSVAIELASGARVADLVECLHGRLPGRLPARPTVVVNRRVALDDCPIEAKDEVAIVPPMAGG